MCTNGVNTGQLEMMIDQIDDHIKLERRHAHDLGHLASDAGFATVGEKLHDVMHLLDEVRAALDEANRSEVVRDLVRDALVEEECATPGGLVMGTLTIIYDHHSNDLQEKLHAIQHDYFDTIISTMHVHVDEHMCLEVIVMRGETGLVQSVANLILGTKGVKNGKLVLTTTGRFM